MVIIPTVDELTEPTVMRNMRKLAQGVDKNFNDMQTSVDNAVETANNAMEATEGFDDRITDNATAIQNEVTARQNADEAEADARAKADITGIITAISSGAINITLNRELGNLSDYVVGPFIKTATLIPSATDRAFKLQFQYWDDTTYTTNDFVIPEGGGTDVSVSGVTVSEGDNDNEFKVSIQLDDATTIDSNSYPFPESVTNPYPTAVLLSIGGTSATTLNIDITLSNSQHVKGSVDLANLFTDYAKTADVDEQISDIQEQITGLKLSKPTQNQIQLNGDNVNVIEGITGEVVDGKLKLTINGFTGSDIPLPESISTIVQNSSTIQIKLSQSITSTDRVNEQTQHRFNASDNISKGALIRPVENSEIIEINYSSPEIRGINLYYTIYQTVQETRYWYKFDNLIPTLAGESGLINNLKIILENYFELENGSYKIGIGLYNLGTVYMRDLYMVPFIKTDEGVTINISNGNWLFGEEYYYSNGTVTDIRVSSVIQKVN